MQSTNKFMIGVFGPTAAGKTKLGVSIAKSVRGEVISHHVIGYLEADAEPDSFVPDAIDRLEELYDNEITPVLVGGSTSLTIPLLHSAFSRGWCMAAIVLLPHQSTYRLNIESRLDEMVESGLLKELWDLRLLENEVLNGHPNFEKGIWKAIGYQDLHRYLAAHETDKRRDQLLKIGIDSTKSNTIQYGLKQPEWIRFALTPLLHTERVAYMNLTVVDKESWASDVETPAVRMANDFCYASALINFKGLSENAKPRVVCIFGGSSPGNDPAHIDAAKSLAKVFHQNNIKLVYGGGTSGIMGAIASTLVELSGPDAVHGIILAALVAYEAKGSGSHVNGSGHARFGKRTVVKDMHSRKHLMTQEVINGGKGSRFIGLSGGYGTFEEPVEVTTWHHLGIHDRGVCVFNVDGFYDGLIEWLDQVVKEGFIHFEDTAILKVATTAEGVIECLDREVAFPRKGQLVWV
ncbi:hypothetical protein HZ326_31537 [Fusarium oxysporum f. sp. albedinis]|nr:hypothetical protein HZ326_31537 [Fusarium oxysporum f. sp. albedinis]